MEDLKNIYYYFYLRNYESNNTWVKKKKVRWMASLWNGSLFIYLPQVLTSCSLNGVFFFFSFTLPFVFLHDKWTAPSTPQLYMFTSEKMASPTPPIWSSQRTHVFLTYSMLCAQKLASEWIGMMRLKKKKAKC